jgi:hypothetical protein
VNLPAGELALVDSVPLWFNDPLRYVREAFDWGRGELIDFEGPDVWQVDVLRDIGNGTLQTGEALRIAVASGHGIGKSSLIAWIILWAMSTRPHLNGVCTANTSIQLETKTWRELALWHKRAINRHWFEWTATKFYQVDHQETWFVSAIPWREERSEAFAGTHAEHVLMLMDEGSAIADVIWEVSEGAMTTPGAIWCVFGNPTKNTGRFRECFGAHRARWNTRQIDSRTSKLPSVNQAEIASQVQTYGEDSDFIRVRVRGVFPRASDAQFINSEAVERAQEREITLDRGAALVMGVDVARFGGDQSIIRFRAGRDARSWKPMKFRGLDTMQIAGFVCEAADKYQPEAIFIDGNGVGGGVVDRCKSLGYRVREVQFGAKPRKELDYANKRAECWGEMRAWVDSGCIDADKDLAADMTAVQYGFDNQNRIQLERKEDMKKRGLASPDDGDALALTFAEPIARADSPMRPRRAQFADAGNVFS